MHKKTAKHKLSNNLSKKYQFDYRKDGKLDIIFIRHDEIEKNIHKYSNNDIAPYFWKIGMNDPEKIYFNYVLIRPRDGGEASVEN